MKEVKPKELIGYNEKSWKDTQKIFRRRLREIAKNGNCVAQYCETEYYFGKRVKTWLEGLGFTVKPEERKGWYEITWPEQKTIAFGSRNGSCYDLKRFDTEREWVFDPRSYDFVCTGCGKHAEYQTPHCPNCGAKMKEEKENE